MNKELGNLISCLVLLFAAAHQVYRVVYYETDAFDICIAIGFWLAFLFQVWWIRRPSSKVSPSSRY